jgi:hypothetical protein
MEKKMDKKKEYACTELREKIGSLSTQLPSNRREIIY